ncbi:UNVERIFIED_CONTAM: hypothetical protein GTU68_033051 [Idotea baltica]|nr:hypothetical protein [Idotea baltica]
MNRRDFKKLLIWGSVAASTQSKAKTKHLVKPAPLRTGDLIGLIAPGSAIPEEKISKSISTLEDLGLQYKMGEFARSVNGYLAGTDAERLSDLHQMFSDPDIKGIWCLRGGYGCTRLLSAIDYDLVARNPKVLIGYSDITALHLAFYQKCSLVTFHGPVASSEPTLYSIESLKQMVFENGSLMIRSSMDNGPRDDSRYVIKGGIAEGNLVGGNLSLLAAMVGTDCLPSFENKLVFIEDIGEKPYRIDRMLVQLFQATDLSSAAGIIFGQFNDCEAEKNENSYTLKQTLMNQIQHLNIPIYYGFSFGHVNQNCTIPLGIRARFDTNTATLELLESPTST